MVVLAPLGGVGGIKNTIGEMNDIRKLYFSATLA